MRSFSSVLNIIFLGFFFAVFLSHQASADAPISPENSFAHFLDNAVNKVDKSALQGLLAPEFMEDGLTDAIFAQRITRALYLENLDQLRRVFDQLNRTSQILASSPDSLTLKVTWKGKQVQTYLGVAPSGRAVAWESLEHWALNGAGQSVALTRQVDRFALIQALTDPRPSPMAVNPMEAETLATFPQGTFLESIIADQNGVLYVTKLFTNEIVRVTPDGHISAVIRVDFTKELAPLTGLLCITWADKTHFFASVHSPDPEVHGIWRIGLDGDAEQIVTLPLEAQPNGITTDAQGRIYSADSALGVIWRVDPENKSVERWYTGPEVSRRAYVGRFPGANGIQQAGDIIYVVSSDRALLSKIPIQGDGTAGQPVVIAKGVPGDDFAVASDGGIYLTTHPFNTIIKISPDGSLLEEIASVDEGVIGPTAAVITTTSEKGRVLYVITDGGFYAPIEGRPIEPAIISIPLN